MSAFDNVLEWDLLGARESGMLDSVTTIQAAIDELRALREQNAEMREVLASVEWEAVSWDEMVCPACGEPRNLGRHTAYCRLAKAIGRTT